MKRDSLIVPMSGKLDELIEELIRNWREDPTGLSKVLKKNEGINESKSSSTQF